MTHDTCIRIAKTDETAIADLTYLLNGVGEILKINNNKYKYDTFDRIISAKTQIPGKTDKRLLVEQSFGAFTDKPAFDGKVYDPAADLNTDNRINGLDYILAAKDSRDGIYDNETFSYDKNGNRTKLVQNGDTYTYTCGINNRLDKVELMKKGTVIKTLFAQYQYDANGNTVKRTIYKENNQTQIITFEYDTMNRLVKTTEGTKITEYFYDNAGNRFIKKDGKEISVYLRHGQIAVAMDMSMSVDATADQGTVNRYVLSGDLLAGRITMNFVKDLTTDQVNVYTQKYWYHLDHLNSTKAVTKADGSVDCMYEYRAFGEELKKLGEGDAKYTYGGKELDGETNLYYFNARYYDATIGRFINVDPVQDGTNWYVYCGNNPLKLVDPTGLRENIIYSFEVINPDLNFLKNQVSELRNQAKELRDMSSNTDWHSIGTGLAIAIAIQTPPGIILGLITGVSLKLLNEARSDISEKQDKFADKLDEFIGNKDNKYSYSLAKLEYVKEYTNDNGDIITYVDKSLWTLTKTDQDGNSTSMTWGNDELDMDGLYKPSAPRLTGRYDNEGPLSKSLQTQGPISNPSQTPEPERKPANPVNM